jgi:predicted dehydrogenase
MRVLIVGLGYMGTRFLEAFRALRPHLRLAYAGRRRTRDDLPYFDSVEAGLLRFQPDIVVVTVNDAGHGEILAALAGYGGFVVCEKPLLTPDDDVDSLALGGFSGFTLDLPARYAEVTLRVRDHIAAAGLRLLRARFHWAKNRIGDHRPTCGVTSEVIHPLDLVRWIAAPAEQITVDAVAGTRSDFSVSGPRTLDTVAVTGRLGTAVLTGYSSFVSLTRYRELELTLQDANGELMHAVLTFDTPRWGADEARVWRPGQQERPELRLRTEEQGSIEQIAVRRLSRLVDDVVNYVDHGREPALPFAGAAESLTLQRLLNDLEHGAGTPGPVRYFPHGHPDRDTEIDWEKLG